MSVVNESQLPPPRALEGPIAVLMTTHNRRDITLACLRALRASLGRANVSATLYLVDDGSRDGTADAVRACWPDARVIHGNGDLFWCRGMHRAFEAARQDAPAAYLWLNDDTQLHSEAIGSLLDTHALLQRRHARGLIVVGTTADASGRLTYGGERRASRWNPLSLRLVPPSGRPQPLATMNGNIVFVDAAAAHHLGNLDPTFVHAMGDTDYGMRAVRAGVGLVLAPGLHGTCNGNAAQGTFADRSLPLLQRLRRMADRKGLPWRAWLHLTRRHGGRLWPVIFAWPYLRVVIESLRPRGPQARA